jgi:hypothetical protein
MTRRRTPNHRRRNWIAAAVVALLALFLAYGILPIIVIAAIAAAFFGARWYRSAHPAAIPAPQRRRAAPRRQQDDAWTITPPRPRTAPTDARARRNGWVPPASTNLRAVSISAECATDEHVFCPGAGCGCPCSHDPAVIGAMNAARHAANPAAPTDTDPIPF